LKHEGHEEEDPMMVLRVSGFGIECGSAKGRRPEPPFLRNSTQTDPRFRRSIRPAVLREDP
jgi:hypothetical protein